MSILGYSVATLDEFVGKELGVSDWVTIDQARIDAFAQCTGDKQWIHVDVERAARESPFGGTIAHGYLTLSLLASLAMEVGLIPADAGRSAAAVVIDALARRHCAAQPLGHLAETRPRVAVCIAIANHLLILDIAIERVFQRFDRDLAFHHATPEPTDQALARFSFKAFYKRRHRSLLGMNSIARIKGIGSRLSTSHAVRA